MSPRTRKPRFDPQTTLVAYWDESEQDIMFAYPSKPDGHMLMGAFTYAPSLLAGARARSLRDELEARGYDIKTLRFSVQRKPPTKPPHVTAVDACPHGCVGACSLCARSPEASGTTHRCSQDCRGEDHAAFTPPEGQGG